MISTVTHSPEETLEFGSRLGVLVDQGVIVSLSGSLGAGKTWFTKGLASAYTGIDVDEVNSPAFNLVNEYGSGDRRVVHIDFYRLDSLNITDALLFEEYLNDTEAVTVVEWGERFLPSLVASYLQIDIVADPSDETMRLITLTSAGGDATVHSLLQRMESA